MGLDATVSADMPTPALDWRQIFQAMPDGLIVIGLDFDVMFVNRAFAALSGVDEIQAIGRKCYDIFPGSLCHGPACPMARILAGVEQLVYEADKHCLCGRLIPSIFTAAPYRQTDGTLAETIYQHHERLDGSGYPRGLKGGEILLEARILAVADVVEAISSLRPYRNGLGIGAALSELEMHSGSLYDASVIAACEVLFRQRGFDFDSKCWMRR